MQIVQEVSQFLPTKERLQIMNTVQKHSAENKKTMRRRKWSNTLPSASGSSKPLISDLYFQEQTVQKYTAKNDSSERETHEKHKPNNIINLMKGVDQKNTLLGSCRAARIREDSSVIHFQHRFKMELLNRNKLI